MKGTLCILDMVLDEEFGEPLWDPEEIDSMIAAGVITPVKKPEEHYRLVVQTRSGKIHRWPMKRLALAEERALWYLLPENRSLYWRDCLVSIEVQHAAPWATVATLTPPGEEATA